MVTVRRTRNPAAERSVRYSAAVLSRPPGVNTSISRSWIRAGDGRALRGTITSMITSRAPSDMAARQFRKMVSARRSSQLCRTNAST